MGSVEKVEKISTALEKPDSLSEELKEEKTMMDFFNSWAFVAPLIVIIGVAAVWVGLTLGRRGYQSTRFRWYFACDPGKDLTDETMLRHIKTVLLDLASKATTAFDEQEAEQRGDMSCFKDRPPEWARPMYLQEASRVAKVRFWGALGLAREIGYKIPGNRIRDFLPVSS